MSGYVCEHSLAQLVCQHSVSEKCQRGTTFSGSQSCRVAVEPVKTRLMFIARR